MGCCKNKEGKECSCKEKLCFMMQCCMKSKKCPVVLLSVGIVLFLIALFFGAAFIKGLWFFIAVVVIAMGAFCFFMKGKCGECLPGEEGAEKTEEEKKE